MGKTQTEENHPKVKLHKEDTFEGRLHMTLLQCYLRTLCFFLLKGALDCPFEGLSKGGAGGRVICCFHMVHIKI